MINWHAIDTVLLDMDGTLLDLHFDNYFWMHHLPKRYAESHGVDESAARDEIHEKIRQLEGTLEWYCLDHWSELMRLDIPALKAEVKHKIQIRPHTESFLSRLKDLDKKLVLITNSHPKGLALKLEVTEIDRWLDIIISSHEFQSPKEDQEFWRLLQLHEPFDVKRTLFVDDTPRVLRSAQKFGIEHLVCVTAPDSQKPIQDAGEFFGVSHFDEIMPAIRTSGGRDKCH